MKTTVFALMFAIISAVHLSQAAEGPEASSSSTEGNPFFAEFDTPFGVPPFDRIKPAHFMPAFEEGMKQQQAAIARIVAEEQPPTFANTLEPLEYSGLFLSNVRAVFSNLVSADTNEALQAVEKEVTPLLSKHADDILLNARLFERVKAVYDQRGDLPLSPEQRRLLEETYLDFARNGVALPADKQDELRKLNGRLSLLGVQFSNNLLAETNDLKVLVENEAELKGLPAAVVASAADAAAKAGQQGKWLFSADRSMLIPVLTFADDRSLRERLHNAYVVRGDRDNEHDNKAITAEMAKLRIERAKLLGYKHHADYVLEKRMAKTAEQVYGLMDRMWEPALNRVKQEAADLQKMIEEEGGDFELQPWDWWYYAEKLRQQRYQLSEADLKPYFELKNVRDGAFDVLTRLYGVKFIERRDLPKYQDDVETFEVTAADGKHLGILYMDYHPRAGKRPGAWKSNYREQYRQGDKSVTPVVVNVFNFPRATADSPALLSLEEVETLFHELGHGIHGLLSNVTYPGLSGTKVARDFVELPSQVLENWATHPDVLRLYARHYRTGEAMPDALIEKIQKSQTFNQGFVTIEYLSAAYLDMGYHTMTDEQAPLDVKTYEKELLTRIGMVPQIVVRYRTPYFLHIFRHGYEAGYYSYLWSEVIDADAFEAFAQRGVFDAKTAAAFHREILARGNTEDPMAMYVKFRGREPQLEPLLKRRGFVSEGTKPAKTE